MSFSFSMCAILLTCIYSLYFLLVWVFMCRVFFKQFCNNCSQFKSTFTFYLSAQHMRNPKHNMLAMFVNCHYFFIYTVNSCMLIDTCQLKWPSMIDHLAEIIHRDHPGIHHSGIERCIHERVCVDASR